MQTGLLIGSDKYSEELIPWWWGNYSSYCNLPVAIVDFGMSKKMRAWCDKRMQVILLKSTILVMPKDEISSEHHKLWKKQYHGPLWQAREAWFKKPKACLLTPFDLTLWLDLDCEICGPLDVLFSGLEKGMELAIGLQDFRLNGPTVYNSGVVLFRKGSPFLNEWDLRCKKQNGSHMGDQDVLTAMLLEGKIPFQVLPPQYNWLMYSGIQPGIVIAHWAAGWGKEYIKKFGGLNKLQKKALLPFRAAKLK